MTNKFLKILLFIFITISFSACEEKSTNTQANKEEEQVIFTPPQLPMPEWDEEGGKKIWDAYKNWHDAKHGPISATQIGYAYANKLQDYEKALQWFEYSNSMKATADNSAYACYVLQEMKQYDKAIEYYKLSANKGFTDALTNIGYIYEEKLKDYNQAEQWYLKAVKEKSYKGFHGLSYFVLF